MAVAAGESTAVDAGAGREEEGEELSLVVGDSVVIGVNENKLRDLQEDYGGLSDSMITVSVVIIMTQPFGENETVDFLPSSPSSFSSSSSHPVPFHHRHHPSSSRSGSSSSA